MSTKPKSWDTELYEGRFSFVWNLGAGLIDLLQPQPGERILDLGCGTGHLTQQIAERGAEVFGLDSDAAMVAQARMNYPKLRFALADARTFHIDHPVDAFFSNAVLHWVKPPEQAIAAIRDALVPGGRLVVEFGGKANAAQVLAAVTAETGVSTSPWFFPSLGEYAALLEAQGFRVTHGFEIDRDTALEGERGLEDWLDMFGPSFFETTPPSERAAARKRVAERVRPTLYRDGQWYVDYKRLRVRAVREK